VTLLTPEERLEQLGLVLPDPPTPAAAYVPYQRTGEVIHVSGQIAMADGALLARGRVGEDVAHDDAVACARQCALNVLAQLRAAAGQLRHVRRLVKASVFVASHPDFTDQHLVANGASELLADVLGDAGVHARSAVGVAALPMGSPVEVEAVAEIA